MSVYKIDMRVGLRNDPDAFHETREIETDNMIAAINKARSAAIKEHQQIRVKVFKAELVKDEPAFCTSKLDEKVEQ